MSKIFLPLEQNLLDRLGTFRLWIYALNFWSYSIDFFTWKFFHDPLLEPLFRSELEINLYHWNLNFAVNSIFLFNWYKKWSTFLFFFMESLLKIIFAQMEFKDFLKYFKPLSWTFGWYSKMRKSNYKSTALIQDLSILNN